MTKSSSKRPEGSVGRRTDPFDWRVRVINSKWIERGQRSLSKALSILSPSRAFSLSALFTLITSLLPAPTTTTPILRIASSILAPLSKAAPSK